LLKYSIGVVISFLLGIGTMVIALRFVNTQPLVGLGGALIAFLIPCAYVLFLNKRYWEAREAMDLMHSLFPNSTSMDLSYIGIDKTAVREIYEDFLDLGYYQNTGIIGERELSSLLNKKRKRF
jgi:hypothetical protein